jgi:hypothetical protein
MNIRTFDPDEFGPEEPHPFDAIIDGINGPEFTPLKRMLDFPIHAKCLELLRRQVTVRFDQHFIWRLWEVCRSMPFHEDTKLLDWDHLYGEIEFPLDEAYIEPNSPWGDGIVPRRIDSFTTPNPMAFATARAAQSIKRSRTTSAPNDELEYSLNGPILPTRSRATGRLIRGDYFAGCFSLDILLMIAQHLPLRDLMSVCLASPAFGQVLDFQSFWRTRFQRGGERHWFFEVRRLCLPDGHFMDWRELFENTRTNALSPCLLNRRRIWNLIPNILEATSVSWEGRSMKPTDWISDDSNS